MCENHTSTATTEAPEEASSCCSTETAVEERPSLLTEEPSSTCSGHAAAPAEESDQAECPVMRGSFVSKADAEAQGLVREYMGEKYYLCCAACGPLFDADPEKYVSAL